MTRKTSLHLIWITLFLALPLSTLSSRVSLDEPRVDFWASFPAADSGNEMILLRFRDEILAAGGLEGGFEALELPPELSRRAVSVLGTRIGEKNEFAVAFPDTALPGSLENSRGWSENGRTSVWQSHPDIPQDQIDSLVRRAQEGPSGETPVYEVRMQANWMLLPRPGDSSVVELPGGSLGEALSSIESVRIAGEIGEEVDFSFQVDFPKPSLAEVVADAWHSQFIGYRNQAAGAQQLLQSLSRGEVVQNGSHLEVRIPFSLEALQRLQQAKASRQFLFWQNLGYGREAREKAPELFRHLGAVPGARLADLGAGSGFYTVRLARAVGAEGRVFGADISEKILRNLEDRIDAGGLENVEIVTAQADDPGLAGQDLDGVLIVNAYHEMRDYQKILVHLKGSLKPGGRLVLLEPYSPENMELSREAQTEKHEIAPELVVKDVEAAGFRVTFVDRQFGAESHAEHEHHNALIVAVNGG